MENQRSSQEELQKRNNFNKQLTSSINNGEKLLFLIRPDGYEIFSFYEKNANTDGTWAGESLSNAFKNFILERNVNNTEVFGIDLLDNLERVMREELICEIHIGKNNCLECKKIPHFYEDAINGPKIQVNTNWSIYGKEIKEGVVDFYSMFQTIIRMKEIVK